ncbi:DUF4097 domain-containing protein [Paenibacillus sp. ACRRX]|uniref:DUF4097 family beta strand repeat-containing protein n=1 Tax=Paenibacillus sp. ACRRX TaxID=2918206 RepID=UPI001EF49A08|nr:DUF4097 family beta strand repeat-containing protein [Paenibacillus sp. ACRRX]MCG7406182.1 DUF4097 domain-containing protein [Paenibacillus sp. ACRRX]
MKLTSAVKKIGHFILFVVIVLSLSSCDGITMLNSTTVDVQMNASVTNVSAVSIQAFSANIKVTAANVEEAKVHLTGKLSGDEKEMEKLLRVDAEGSNLNIQLKRSNSMLVTANDLTLDIELPSRRYKQLSVQASSGNIDLQRLETDHLSTHVSSGNIKIDQFEGNKFEAESSSGNIEVNKLAADAAIKATSGNVMITLAKLDKPLSAETSSGNVTITVPKDAKARLKADTKWDNMKIDVPFTITNKEKRQVEGILNNAQADAALFYVKTTSGQFDLKQ